MLVDQCDRLLTVHLPIPIHSYQGNRRGAAQLKGSLTPLNVHELFTLQWPTHYAEGLDWEFMGRFKEALGF
jgi:hypothetical protein